MVENLIEINKHDQATIEYLNARANQAMSNEEYTYED